MRKTAVGWMVTLLVSVALCASAYGADVAKIGVVNFQKILEASDAGKAGKAELSDQGQKMEIDLKAKRDEIKAIEKQLERAEGVMSKDAREEKEWEKGQKIRFFNELKKKYDKRLQRLQMRLVNRIRKEVLQVIQEIGEKEGYLLIVERASAVYAPQSLDVTDKVIQMYNDRVSVKSGGQAGKKP